MRNADDYTINQALMIQRLRRQLRIANRMVALTSVFAAGCMAMAIFEFIKRLPQ